MAIFLGKNFLGQRDASWRGSTRHQRRTGRAAGRGSDGGTCAIVATVKQHDGKSRSIPEGKTAEAGALMLEDLFPFLEALLPLASGWKSIKRDRKSIGIE
jgi:hypothetical protein